MKHILSFFILILVLGCSDGKHPILGATEWQKKMNSDFKDASKSPLKEKDRKSFKSLDFFEVDSTYVVLAHLERTPNTEPFKMKTTTDRMPLFKQYGIVTFDLKGQTFQLNIYQDLELMHEKGYEDYLFLPFLDDTNGDSTYGGGRYVECRMPEDDKLAINFNEAYNPYCVYNEKYSCPIVPRANYIATKVEAGIKNFKK
ncbi:DUF1684 domain-containing protein [Corallibacter sp.]|uniref:DUF1684 domain-containing protein n=1 Tax=Corallibacter sp. TaxID=2038084 RepID=UPI003A8F8B69